MIGAVLPSCRPPEKRRQDKKMLIEGINCRTFFYHVKTRACYCSNHDDRVLWLPLSPTCLFNPRCSCLFGR